ncbi:hypothetical protein ACF1HJ_35820 [Streptomyces sp. NPDC013978]|uniref:hypothetical protein n=1 Tax=Streptomyces sp. NPDC013978 TaxID=3364869 RepID=UPI003701FEC7
MVAAPLLPLTRMLMSMLGRTSSLASQPGPTSMAAVSLPTRADVDARRTPSLASLLAPSSMVAAPLLPLTRMLMSMLGRTSSLASLSAPSSMVAAPLPPLTPVLRADPDAHADLADF